MPKLFPHFVQNWNPLKFYERNPFKMNNKYLDKFDFDNAEIEEKIPVSGISLWRKNRWHKFSLVIVGQRCKKYLLV